MKNFVLATTALTAVAFAGSAAAQIDAEIKGTYNFDVTYVTYDLPAGLDAAEKSVQFGQDWEFELNGKFEMDNGITAFADLEIDASGDSEATRTDDISFGLSGSFGKLTMGTYDYTKNGSASIVPFPALNDPTTKLGSELAVPDFTHR